MGRFFLFSLFMTVVLLPKNSNASAEQIRVQQITTSAFGPKIEDIVNSLNLFLRESNRKIVSVVPGVRNGFGQLLSAQVTHTSNILMCADPTYVNVVVPPVENAFAQAKSAAIFQAYAGKHLVDIEITESINVGTITGLRLYFCN